MASDCDLGSCEFHSHPDGVRRSTSAHSGREATKPHLCYLSPPHPPFPGAWSTDWISALISLQASSLSRAEVIFSSPNCSNASVHPNPGLSICCEWSQQPPGRLCKHRLLGGQVPCPGLHVWAYPAMDQAQGCLTLILCKDQSMNRFMSPSPCHHQPGLPITSVSP